MGGEVGLDDSDARLEAMNIRGDVSSCAESSDSDVMAARSFVSCDSERPSLLANVGTLNDLTFCEAYNGESLSNSVSVPIRDKIKDAVMDHSPEYMP